MPNFKNAIFAIIEMTLISIIVGYFIEYVGPFNMIPTVLVYGKLRGYVTFKLWQCSLMSLIPSIIVLLFAGAIAIKFCGFMVGLLPTDEMKLAFLDCYICVGQTVLIIYRYAHQTSCSLFVSIGFLVANLLVFLTCVWKELFLNRERVE